MIHVTLHARSELGEDEVLVFAWHRVALCSATAGEVSAMPRPARRDVTIDAGSRSECAGSAQTRRPTSDCAPSSAGQRLRRGRHS